MIETGLCEIYDKASAFSGTGSYSDRMSYFESAIDMEIPQIYNKSYVKCVEGATDRLRYEINNRIAIGNIIKMCEYQFS